MAHSNRSTTARTGQGYVIQLSTGRLWKNFGASDAAIFSTLENAKITMAGYGARRPIAGRILRLTSICEEGAAKVGGYWTIAI